ncbi:hypothetical protein HK103_002912 [Boothiomyces macroporosus]|uniref:Uncharacterized protein n=1 Tax=Boothiomyces macroporosus TaxID=261099 RepID=A0AAD5UCE9_9FUNG|nr:hypothetical protein HK103_002912 [Boothiomyces macroporosus]
MFQILLSTLAASVSAYSLCNPTNYPYKGQTVSVPIQPAAAAVIVNQITVPVTVSGNIKVIDGCTFAVSNLAFSGPSFIQFVGRLNSDTTGAKAVLLTSALVPATIMTNAQYTFVQTAGNWVSYNDFDIIELFDPASKSVIGVANMPAKPVVTTSAAASTSRTTAPAAAAATTGGKTSDSTKATIAGISAFICLAVLL